MAVSVWCPMLPWRLQDSEPLFLSTEDLGLSPSTYKPMGWGREGIWQDVIADPRAARAVFFSFPLLPQLRPTSSFLPSHVSPVPILALNPLSPPSPLSKVTVQDAILYFGALSYQACR